jgi:hypothetical protein
MTATRVRLFAMSRRLVEAFAVLALPAALVAVGWIQPGPLDAVGRSAPSLLADVAIVAAGALATVLLVRLGRDMAARQNGGRAPYPDPVAWLVAGWPLPFPRRRGEDVTVSGMPEAERPLR